MKLYHHQVEALRKIHLLDGRAGLFIAMGGGKTRVALAYPQLTHAQRVLVVLPLSVVSVWERECSLIGFSLPVHDATGGSIKQRATAIQGLGCAIVLVNYEAYWREPLRSAIDKWAPDTIVLDEAHRIRHRGSRQTRFAHLLSMRPYVKRRLALTGTPITNGLQDAWSIYKFIDPRVFGTRWVDFQNRYLIMGGFQFRQITGYRMEDEAKRKITQTSFQWEGMTPAPPDIPITVRLSQSTRKVYDELKKKAIVEVQNARGQNSVVIARLALTLLLRLQQITSGFTKDVGEEEIELGTEKADACEDLISDAVAQGERVVVFARFIHDLDLLKETLQSYRVALIRGGQTSAQRKAIVQGFDNGEYDVVLVQVKAGGLGIDLASASVGIFYSVGFSLDDFLQAKGRLTGSLRQRHPVVFYHLLAERTVDQTVYGALLAKTKIASQVTDLRYALNLLGG